MNALMDALGYSEVTLELTREQFRFIDHVCEVTGMTPSELARRAFLELRTGSPHAVVDALPQLARRQ